MLKRISYYPPNPELLMFKQFLQEVKASQEVITTMERLITPEKPKLAMLSGAVGDDGDYLSSLAIGAEFLSRKEPSILGYDIQLWQVRQKTRFARLLCLSELQEVWVTPLAFCQRNKLIEVINDGNGNRTNRSTDVEPDAPDQHKLDLDA